MAIRFLLKNLADLATITSSDFAATLPVTNLQTEGRGKVARTSNATGTKTINGNLAAASSINCVVLSRHNLTSSATWRLQLYSAANQTTQVYDSTAVTPAPAASVFAEWDAVSAFSVLYFSTVAGVLSFRVELANATNPAGYLEAKRLLLGAYFEPATNVEYGLGLDWMDESVQRRTLGSSIRTDGRAKYRRITATMARLTEAERATFADAVRYAGTSREVFVSAWPGATGAQERDYSMVGKFPALPKFANHEYNNHRAAFEIEEA
jgi:hypothetical protein